MTQQVLTNFVPQKGIWKPWDTYEEMTEGLDLNSLDDEQLKKLCELKIECERRKRNSPIMFYKPYESRNKKGYFPQLEFHKSNAQIRLLLGGNRCLPLDAPILMADGKFKPLHSVVIGDSVICAGKPTHVVATHLAGKKECFKVTFEDGGHVIASREHEFPISFGSGRKFEKRKLGELIDRKKVSVSKKARFLSYKDIEFVDNGTFKKKQVFSKRIPNYIHRVVKSIESIGEVECGDLTVNHSDHCFVSYDWVVTGNSGKTFSGAAELVMAALGIHPFINFPVPGEYWIVSLTNQMSIEVAEDKIRQLIGVGNIRRWDRQYRVMYLVNGTKIGFKSCEQDINTFGGTAKDGIWFDEEPPGEHGFQIYKECRMRTIDRDGKIWFTMTPVQGISWTADEIYEPSVAGNNNYKCIELSTYDNPHLSEAVIKEIEKDCTEEERDMRFFGKYVQFSGLVYKEFDRNIHVVKPFPIPEHWKKYRSIDHGMNNPTACVYMAVNEKEEYFVYDEYYQTDKTVKDNAEAIRLITGGDKIEWTTIDPSTDNRDPITNTSVREEYRRHGIITKAFRSEKMSGINRIKQLLKPDESTGRPKIFIFDTCYNGLKEIQRYRWASHRSSQDVNRREEPQKVMDHWLDAFRYLIMSRPRYKTNSDMDLQPTESWYK